MLIYHRHHVVPRHAGGTNALSNMTCKLTVQEHAEHHRYRYEMLGEWQDRLAWQTLSGMIPNQEIIRQINVENGRTSFLGKTHSEESLRKMSEAARNRSEETLRKMSEAARNVSKEIRRKISEARRGKPGKPHSEETRQKISEAHSGRTFSEETLQKMRENHVGMRGHKHSEETRRKMSETRRAWHAQKRRVER